MHTDMHTCAIGKARVSGVSQGHQRLRALIDCSYGVYVPWPHLSVCQPDAGLVGLETAALGVILSAFPKEEGEMCHACYPSDIDSSDGIQEKGER